MPARRRSGAREWIGGRYRAPGRVLEDGVPTRYDVAIWMGLPEGLIVTTQVGASPMPPDMVVDALLEKLGPPPRGAVAERVRVADPAIAEALRRRLGRAVSIAVAPTPELDAVAAEMQAALGRTRQPRDRGYLQRGRIPADDVAWLFRAAAELWTVAPWRFLSDDQVLALDVPALGVAGACVSVLGQLGESFGFVVFASFDAFARFVDQISDDGPPLGDVDVSGCLAALDYVPRRDLPAGRRREIESHGWPVADAGAHPRVVCTDADGTPRPETAAEVRLVAACAEALAVFCRRHTTAFEHEPTRPITEAIDVRTPDGPMTVRVTAPHPEALNEPPPVLTPVGRNDPCPCGSGRKYKRCHLGAEPPARRTPSDLLALEHRMLRALLAFGESRHSTLLPDVRLVGHPAFDAPWLVFHERIAGRRLVDLFLETRRHGLDPRERAWIEAQQATHLSVWEVRSVAPGATLALHDELTGDTAVVCDDEVSRHARRGDRILARVLRLDDVAILSGAHPEPLGPSVAARIVRNVRRRLGTRARTFPREALRTPDVERALRDGWEDACDAERPALTLSNIDGHALLLTTDHFVFEPAERATIEAAVATLAKRIDDDDHEARFDLSAESHRVAGLERVSIAIIRVGAARVRVETNSRERADAVRSLVEAACGERLRHRAREHSDPMGLMKHTPPPKEPPPIPPEAAQLVLDFKRRHYAGWPDEPLPALDGLTPREAATRPAMRRRLRLLLDDMEHGEGALPPDQRFDFDELRSTLDLD